MYFMQVCFLIGSALLAWLFVFRPLRRARTERLQRAFAEDLRCFRLRTVRRHCPELQELSYREIAERYQVRREYERLY